MTAHVQDERISVPGDSGPDDSELTTRRPSGAAREADRFHRGTDTRNNPTGTAAGTGGSTRTKTASACLSGNFRTGRRDRESDTEEQTKEA